MQSPTQELINASQPYVKQEVSDGLEGLFPSQEIEIPANFERDEWAELTEGFASRNNEISYILAQRGQGGSRKGRPTNLNVPFKGALSNSSHAILQRNRAALRSVEEQAVEKAKAADRAAKYTLRKLLKKKPEYQELSASKQKKQLCSEEEQLAQSRFDDCKSAEWLETKLLAAHKKWDKLENDIDMRAHNAALGKIGEAIPKNAPAEPESRAKERLFGTGGVLENILRQTYKEGLAKLKSNSFKSKAAKEEWVKFRDELSPKELALVMDENWQRSEPPSILEQVENPDNITLYGSRPYVMGDDSDECEEEVDDSGTELENYFKSMPDAYDSDTLAVEDEEDLEEADSEGSTDFEGFSD